MLSIWHGEIQWPKRNLTFTENTLGPVLYVEHFTAYR